MDVFDHQTENYKDKKHQEKCILVARKRLSPEKDFFEVFIFCRRGNASQQKGYTKYTQVYQVDKCLLVFSTPLRLYLFLRDRAVELFDCEENAIRGGDYSFFSVRASLLRTFNCACGCEPTSLLPKAFVTEPLPTVAFKWKAEFPGRVRSTVPLDVSNW